ncbi:Ankyrin repeats containing protein [Cardinium endosymbiont of Sogatella furcifera]|nr:Ankyrin repeats containing protein [Cardinium endosymbiont of Sogatella furcifera]
MKHTGFSKMLLQYGADVNVLDGFGNTPLYYASKNRDLNLSKLLSDRGADPNIENIVGYNPVDMAIEFAMQSGNSALLESFLQKTDGVLVDTTILHRLASLHKLPKEEYLKVQHIIELSISKYNAKVCAVNSLRMNPVHIASIRNNGEIIRMLVNLYSVNVNQPDNKGETALHKASKLGNIESAKALLDCGANINEENNDGETPLDKANSARDKWKLKLEETSDVELYGIDFNNISDTINLLKEHGAKPGKSLTKK